MIRPVRVNCRVAYSGLQPRLFYWACFFAFGLSSVLSLPAGFAQNTGLSDDPTGRFGSPPSITKERPIAPAPSSPELLPPIPSVPQFLDGLPPLMVFIQEIRVVGSTVFSAQELSNVVRPYMNRELSTEDLEELRQAVTNLHIEHGYITSGAVLPDQDLGDGVLTLRIVEGELSDINVVGTEQFQPWFFTSRLRLSSGPPVNINTLREQGYFIFECNFIDNKE